MKTYRINEYFFSLQGEGIRAGTPNIFLRFSGCNETCRFETHGFDCDTEFSSGRKLSLPEILAELRAESPNADWVVLTGGEPALQVDEELIQGLHGEGYQVAIETNGTIELPPGIDWVTVSPKGAEHTIRQVSANEVKYVRAFGQGIPKTRVDAPYRLISPAFSGERLEKRNLDWCIQLVKENPSWRLSLQQHKLWQIR